MPRANVIPNRGARIESRHDFASNLLITMAMPMCRDSRASTGLGGARVEFTIAPRAQQRHLFGTRWPHARSRAVALRSAIES